MANTIENTVTFSGSDISVIAYRGGRTPAEEFTLEKTERELDETKTSIDSLKKKSNELSTQRLVELSDAEKQSQLSASLGESPGGGFSSINDLEGSYRNNIHLARAGVLKKEISDLSSQMKSLNKKHASLSEKIAEMGKLSSFSLGSIHTISYSSFREKMAVRSLGRTQAKAYTRGARTIAGTMVFNVFQEHEFLKLLGAELSSGELSDNPIHPKAVMLDQIYPFNLLLIFANEYGAYSSLHLLNIDIQSEGQQMSVDSVLTHNTMNFYATDMIPMTSMGNAFGSYDEMVTGWITEVTGGGDMTTSVSFNRNSMDTLIKNPFSREDEYSKLLAQSRGLF